MNNKLLDIIENIVNIKDNNLEELAKITFTFLEELSVSSPEDIKYMIEYVYEKHYMEFPFGLKLIAFRLLVLLKPDDIEVKIWAKADAEMFGGPEWKENVNKW